MNNPLISVYIPTHNRSEMLKRAVFSVLNQTYKNVEIIICDDGSSDNTEEVVTSLREKYPNIKYLKNETPKGACAARNLGIFSAKGEFVTGLDDDDEFFEERLEQLHDFFSSTNDSYAFVCGGIEMREKGITSFGYTKPGIVSLDDLLSSNIVGNQVFTKTKYLQEIGGFDTSFPAWQDYDCWVRLCDKFGSGYRVGHVSYIMHMEHEQKRISTSNKVKNGYERFIKMHHELMSEKHRKDAYVNFKLGQNENFTIDEIIRYISCKTLPQVFKSYLKKRLVVLRKVYSYMRAQKLSDRRNSLDKKD
ncbi:Chondroitin polymerase [Serratia grimesii]|jgi:glycosyltransferase involved in cell wall biosynthesis|uniref:glycosyltransferase n=1 Tax=Serratia grimesii TaxID=82995 RepID=UPI00217AFD03|nr:glycosyltransferase [Serratia grimesii]CAI0795848.1 Chondroitin polymerase [Serratia grimesii]CAI2785679.1 Chondroitin polymerase [Serratia grimesii]